MKIITTSKYLRVSPKKAKILVRSIKSLRPKDALERLNFMRDKAAFLLSKVIRSSLANATNNAKLNMDSLAFSTIEVGKGPFSKRWQPVSKGMAHQIKKRTTHIKITLEEVKSQSSKVKIIEKNKSLK